MYCEKCGEKRHNRTTCENCGAIYKKRSKQNFVWVSMILLVVIGAGYFLFHSGLLDSKEQVVLEKKQTKIEEKTIPTTKKKEMEADQEVELTEIIADAQRSVYTILAEESQGSGFLYNDQGVVVTNAHVVEGEIYVFVKTKDGKELPGTVIGYSNETDVAVIMVPDLTGANPYAIEKGNESQVGEEVIALGSPLGLENTATMGFVTGKDRNFLLDHYTYENILQISAPIAPGSSGGPLISKKSQKIVAINSAKSLLDDSIGFSIPIFKVANLIDEWLENPMAEEDILAQFYDANGDYFFGSLWDYGDGYFDGGEYSEDDSYYNYWEYDYEYDWEDDYSYEDDDYFYDDELYEEDDLEDWDDSYEENWSWDDGDAFDEELEDPAIAEAEEAYELLYDRMLELEEEIERIELELYEYPEHSEEYREILEEQIELYEEMEEVLEELYELQ